MSNPGVETPSENGENFICLICLRSFSSNGNLLRHTRTVNHNHKCKSCSETFISAGDLKHHVQTSHLQYCEICNKPFTSVYLQRNHLKTCLTRVKQYDKKQQLLKEELIKQLLEKQKQRNDRIIANQKLRNERIAKEEKLRKERQTAILAANMISNPSVVLINQGPRVEINNPPQENSVCHICDVTVLAANYSRHLRTASHIERASKPFSSDRRIVVNKEAFEGNLITYSVNNYDKEGTTDEFLANVDIDKFLFDLEETVGHIIEFELKTKKNLKFRLFLVGFYTKSVFNKESEVFEDVEERKYLYGRFKQVDNAIDLGELVRESFWEILAQSQDFNENGSGWSLLYIVRLCLEFGKIKYFKGGSYFEIPKVFQRKLALLNIRNFDDHCLLYCVAAFMYRNLIPVSLQTKASSYAPFLANFNINGLVFPLSTKHIRMFENLNADKNLSFTVFTPTSNNLVSSPIYRSRVITENQCLLMLFEGKNSQDNHVSHYVLITDFSRLIARQINNKQGRTYYCETCLSTFLTLPKLELHLEIGCGKIQYTIPKEEKLKFKKLSARVLAEFVCYMDTEAVQSPVLNSPELGENCAWISFKTKHLTSSVGYMFKTAEYIKDDYFTPMRSFFGPDCMKHFLLQLIADVKYIHANYFAKYQPLVCTAADNERLNAQTHCGLCHRELLSSDNVVRDHCHQTSQLRFVNKI